VQLLKRQDAIQIFREICESTPDAFVVDHVILTPESKFLLPNAEGYSLHIKIPPADTTLKIIKTVAAKHQLSVEELGGYLVIFEPTSQIVSYL
jgi:hypothetical protein